MKRVAPKITSKGFTPGKRGTGMVLGKLQNSVMEILWANPPLTVSEVEHKLCKERAIAHTTVLTTMDRLYGKGILGREKQGKAYVYSPRYSRSDFEKNVAREVLSSLLSQLTEPAISAFVDLVGEDDERLDQLEELIRSKREEADGGGNSGGKR